MFDTNTARATSALRLVDAMSAISIIGLGVAGAVPTACLSGPDGADTEKFVCRIADMDGSTDLMTDLTSSGSEQDRIGLLGLAVMSGGVSAAEWYAANAVQDTDGTVTLSLANGTIKLRDHQDLWAVFAGTIFDALIF